MPMIQMLFPHGANVIDDPDALPSRQQMSLIQMRFPHGANVMGCFFGVSTLSYLTRPKQDCMALEAQLASFP